MKFVNGYKIFKYLKPLLIKWKFNMEFVISCHHNNFEIICNVLYIKFVICFYHIIFEFICNVI